MRCTENQYDERCLSHYQTNDIFIYDDGLIIFIKIELHERKHGNKWKKKTRMIEIKEQWKTAELRGARKERVTEEGQY